MSEMIWESLNSLFKTAHRQGKRVEELEQRVFDLERRLSEREGQRLGADIRPEALGYFDVAKGEAVVDENMKKRIVVLVGVGDDKGDAQKLIEQAEALEEDARQGEKEG